jgi:MoaA/NifB/PqqE/SkfB family radical SAM enzyme
MENMYLYTTDKCNQRCLFCVRLGGNEKFNKKLPFDTLKKQIDKVGNKSDVILTFDGGEPTLYENFFNLVDYAISVGMKRINILTNGIRFSDKKFTSALFNRISDKNKVDLSFSVSLHSHIESISDNLTQSKGSYKLTIRGVKNLLKHTNNVSVYHVMTSYNYDKLEDFCKFIVNNFPQIKKIALSYIYPSGNSLKHKEVFPRFSKLKKHLLGAISYLECNNFDIHIPVCGTIPLCSIEGYEEYAINQLKTDRAENVKLFDARGYHDYILSEDYFHRITKMKNLRCDHCILDSICKGIWNVYVDLHGFDGLNPIFVNKCKYKVIDIDINADFEDIANLLNDYKKVVLLNFIFEGKRLSPDIGNKIELFLKSLKNKDVNFLIARPIPKSLFQNNKHYRKVRTGFNIPKSCEGCLYLLLKAKNGYHLCVKKKVFVKKDLIEGKKKGDIYNEFKNKLPKTCAEI